MYRALEKTAFSWFVTLCVAVSVLSLSAAGVD